MGSENRIYNQDTVHFNRDKNRVLHRNDCKIGGNSVVSPLFISASVTQLEVKDGELYSPQFDVIDAKIDVDERHL